MKAREVLRRIAALGGAEVRQTGGHRRVRCACGRYASTVAMHGASDLPTGTVRTIERDLAPCEAFGKGWLR